MAFRPFFEIKKVAGKLIGRDLLTTKEEGARAYAYTDMPIPPGSFTGSLAELEAMISTSADSCANKVKKAGVLRSSGNARDNCLQEIRKAYSMDLSFLQEQSYTEEQAVSAKALEGNTTTLIIGVVMFIVIVILFKSES
jgi:hypothetical protein